MKAQIKKLSASLIVAATLLDPMTVKAAYQAYTIADLEAGFAGANQYGYYAVAKGKILSRTYLYNVCLAGTMICGVTKYTWQVQDVWHNTPATTFYDIGTDTQIFAESYRMNVGQEVVLVLIPNGAGGGGLKAELPKDLGKTVGATDATNKDAAIDFSTASFLKNSENGALPLQPGSYTGSYLAGNVNFTTACSEAEYPNERGPMPPCTSYAVNP